MQFELQDIQYRQNYANASFDLILVDNVPAGRLYVQRNKDDLRVIDIALLPEFRRQGIGKRLFCRLIREADQKRVQLSLHVEHNNPVLPWYERLGFERAGIYGVYYYMKRRPDKNNG